MYICDVFHVIEYINVDVVQCSTCPFVYTVQMKCTNESEREREGVNMLPIIVLGQDSLHVI